MGLSEILTMIYNNEYSSDRKYFYFVTVPNFFNILCPKRQISKGCDKRLNLRSLGS